MKTKKILVLALAALLLVVVSVAGTVAYLTATSGPVTNTFTPTTLIVGLAETQPENKTAPMIPGTTIAKDPKVTYSTDVPAYVFVEVTEAIGEGLTFSNYIGYSVITGTDKWQQVTGVNNVYYMEVAAGNSPEGGISVIQDISTTPVADQVTVKADLELADMTKLDAETKYPTLTFNAYIIQKDPFATAADAWAELNP
nr:hypothetical protein [Clostridia bacterium]